MAKKIKYPGIAAWLAEQGMSKTELAKSLNMSEQQLRFRLTGERKFSADEAIVLIGLTGRSFEDLFI